MKIFRKILIANRGEIAVRIMKTARKLGIKTVAIYSEIDADSLHVSMADEAFCIGGSELSDSYLNIQKIIQLAVHAGAEAIHPGYGFLSENPAFIRACEEEGIIFIGPSSEAVHLMGNKIESRAYVKNLGIPVIEGATGTLEELTTASLNMNPPFLVKAAAGGGGKGMRVVHNREALPEALEATGREAAAYFGNGTVYIEKYLEEPRHIEFQILGDKFGNLIHLYERECSIQRRHQKIIEEAPSPTLDDELRKAIGEAAVTIGKEIGYSNAGTVEFLLDKNRYFYFLEMNTRIQVEHPVTEMTTRTDIVEEQILIAAGNELRYVQEDIVQKGHAIECRVYAESPENNFLPSPGKMSLYLEPKGKKFRIDTGLTPNTIIKSQYDPMICKLIARGGNRAESTGRCVEALKNFVIHGIQTNINYLIYLLESEAFANNQITTRFCDENTEEIVAEINEMKEKIDKHIPVIAFLLYSLSEQKFGRQQQKYNAHDIWNTIGYWRHYMAITVTLDQSPKLVYLNRKPDHGFEFEIDNQTFLSKLILYKKGRLQVVINEQFYTVYISENDDKTVELSLEGVRFQLKREDFLGEKTLPPIANDAADSFNNKITAPMPGTIVKVNVAEGDVVKKGQVLLIMEAMKMENNILAPRDGKVKSVNASMKHMVEKNAVLVVLEEHKTEEA